VDVFQVLDPSILKDLLSFIDARDVAAVAVKALTVDSQQHTGKAYTITA
jgi:uncharacterized protein YbjT (DUF2867 family)